MHHRRFEQRHRVQQRRRVHRRLRRLKQRDHPVITHREQPSFTVDRDLLLVNYATGDSGQPQHTWRTHPNTVMSSIRRHTVIDGKTDLRLCRRFVYSDGGAPQIPGAF
ncbi:hypothetical protein Ae707Ps1_6276c [Pseudonocardia sp. Ae707_Ps1]|nr:hypothetical protein Ae707Ps1_6260c [Pseudonocardia sp. Ae707_Ps1]OLM08763.1 hypothetical protein Ae707Ps1_6276c [Pseudonocardia sp. Ae707_Ps1]